MKVVFFIAWICSLLAVQCAVSQFPVEGVGGRELFFGEGLHIVVRPGIVYEIYADEPAWVRHGWVRPCRGPGWVADVIHERGTVAAPGGFYFSLMINSQKIHLDHQVLVFICDEPGHWGWWMSWYVQFPANFFAPGVYKIRGEWGCRNPQAAKSLPVPWVAECTLIVKPRE